MKNIFKDQLESILPYFEKNNREPPIPMNFDIRKPP
jgi:hypothetical protein